MYGIKVRYLIGMCFIILSISCAKLPEYSVEAEGKLSMEIIDIGDSIPLEWGNLISVSNVNRYANWVQLWFHDEEGNIYMVPYSIPDNKFQDQFRVIHRK